MIKEKELLKEAFSTLLYSWGGDTPPEAIWAADAFLNFFEKETGKKVDLRFNEDADICPHIEDVLKQLE